MFDPFFTPFETLEIQAGLYGVPKAQRQIDGTARARCISTDKAQRLFAHAVGRHEAAAAGRQGDGPLAAGAGARRADRRRRRRAAPAALGLCPRAQRAGRHDRADHALSRGSRGAVRPHRDHQPRPADRQRADPRAGRHGAGEGRRGHRRPRHRRRARPTAASRRSS